MKHTIEQLQAMSDGELAELTARLRGWTKRLGSITIKTRDGGSETVREDHWSDNEGAVIACADWNPAADKGQAYELLTWAKQHGLKFEITIDVFERIAVFPPRRSNFTILGNDARAMAFAFVIAIEASNG